MRRRHGLCGRAIKTETWEESERIEELLTGMSRRRLGQRGRSSDGTVEMPTRARGTTTHRHAVTRHPQVL